MSNTINEDEETNPYERFPAGELQVQCPQCPIKIPIWVEGRLLADQETNGQYLQLRPDYSDLYAHQWTHENDGAS